MAPKRNLAILNAILEAITSRNAETAKDGQVFDSLQRSKFSQYTEQQQEKYLNLKTFLQKFAFAHHQNFFTAIEATLEAMQTRVAMIGTSASTILNNYTTVNKNMEFANVHFYIASDDALEDADVVINVAEKLPKLLNENHIYLVPKSTDLFDYKDTTNVFFETNKESIFAGIITQSLKAKMLERIVTLYIGNFVCLHSKYFAFDADGEMSLKEMLASSVEFLNKVPKFAKEFQTTRYVYSEMAKATSFCPLFVLPGADENVAKELAEVFEQKSCPSDMKQSEKLHCDLIDAFVQYVATTIDYDPVIVQSFAPCEHNVQFSNRVVSCRKIDYTFANAPEEVFLAVYMSHYARFGTVTEVYKRDNSNQYFIIYEAATNYWPELITKKHDMATKLGIATQLVEAIVYMHRRAISHKNMVSTRICSPKWPQNNTNIILITFYNPKPKGGVYTYIRTIYSPPEAKSTDSIFLSNDNISFAADVYSIGAFLFELFTGAKLMKYAIELDKIVDNDTMKALIKDCTSEKQKRPSSMAVLKRVTAAMAA